MSHAKNTAILLVDCPDRKGLVAAVAEFLYTHNANILHADQHQDAERNVFLMRVEWDLTGFAFDLADFPKVFGPIAERYSLRWRLEQSARRPRLALFVSKYDHCLSDLLYRHQSGELACDIPLIVANHPDAERWAKFHGIPFHVLPVNAKNKEQAEAEQIRLCKDHGVDLVVLARYMQILSPRFVAEFPMKVINVHHSFLPAYVGAKPYHRAYERGVKLIGATSHYVTDHLDEGPIIEQDVMRVSHRGRDAGVAPRHAGGFVDEGAGPGAERALAGGAVAHRPPHPGVW
ncbi:MAG: formyltetrahydrofolate deformylase [Fimbriiglobus sp.]|nr:formyltetrahydrofolate deformylase [Fimbriiglobus sp.]